MIRRLHDSFAQVRQFSADASHELRTPLTIMRGEIELALRSTQDTRENTGRVLESTLEEILRMTSIIDNLLVLAKADQGTYWTRTSRRWISGRWSEELYEDSEVLAERKHIAVTLRENAPITIVGDRVRLRQLFLNLIDNAIKYTPEGGTVTLALRRQNGNALFEVHDTGIGIPPEEIGKDLRPVLPRGQGPLARAGRDRAGTLHREMDRGAAPRHDHGHQRAEQGLDVHGHSAPQLKAHQTA